MSRRRRWATALLPLFFVSGATALVYQTVWARQLHLVLGTSTLAIATVLSAFMLGLGLGSFAVGRVADRIARPLAVYGLLELAIGAFAICFPSLLAWATGPYLLLGGALGDRPWAFRIAQHALVTALLVLPTSAMGATLPILARFATDRLGAAGDRIGTLYAVNTAGAVFGIAAAGFGLLPGIGLWGTTVLAAAANGGLGLGALALDHRARATGGLQVRDDLDRDRIGPLRPLLLPLAGVLAVAGFASLVYEVAWTRVATLMIGGSVYAFTVMLLAFLSGIAVGGKAGGALADLLFRREGQDGVLRALAWTEVGIAALSWGLLHLCPELPYWYVWTFDALGADQRPGRMWIASLLVSGCLLTPPAVLMGMALPLAVRAAIGTDDALGAPVGALLGANTLGGAVGAFVAGFVLLPALWVQGAVAVAAAANLAAAAGCLLLLSRRRLPALAAVALLPLGALALSPTWEPLLMTAGTHHYVSHFDDHSRDGIHAYAVDRYELLLYDEGLSSVVTVARSLASGHVWLANNGKVEASTAGDMPTQVLCALLALQFVEHPADVLVIGLASGVTAGAASLVEGVRRLEVVELEPATREAAAFFATHNHHVLDDPRTELIFDDGRNHLLRSAPKRYDAIVSQPSNAWISGVSNLFTLEHWQLGRTRLADGGVWSQWLQTYGMDPRDLASLLRTFATAWPHVLVYSADADADLVLVGSEAPLRPRPEAARRLLAQPDVAAQLAAIGVRRPLELVAPYQLDREAILALTEGAGLVTDDNMRIEFNAPRNLHRDTAGANRALVEAAARVPADVLTADEREQLAALWRARGDARARASRMSAD